MKDPTLKALSHSRNPMDRARGRYLARSTRGSALDAQDLLKKLRQAQMSLAKLAKEAGSAPSAAASGNPGSTSGVMTGSDFYTNTFDERARRRRGKIKPIY